MTEDVDLQLGSLGGKRFLNAQADLLKLVGGLSCSWGPFQGQVCTIRPSREACERWLRAFRGLPFSLIFILAAASLSVAEAWI